MWAGFIWLKAGACKYDNEHYGSVEVGKFFQLLSDYKLSHNGPVGLELFQLSRTCCVVANNPRFSLPSTTDFIVSMSRKETKN